MRQSALITKTRKNAPHGEEAVNAELLIRGGFIHKEMAGVYTLLPLGWKVVQNIEQIVREEMDAAGGQEMKLTALQAKETWEQSGRWSDEELDVWFKTQLAAGGEVGLGATHEEPLTRLLTEHIASYRDLPKAVYQIQTKFRNELRAKSGVLRGREFRMKDLYSFSRSAQEHEAFYEQMKDVYTRVFARLGIGAETYLTFASGGSFAPYSHEFQMVCEAGEDTIYIDTEKNLAINDEVYSDDVCAELGVSKEKLEKKRAIEVGNIFTLGTRFSEAFGLQYKDEEGASSLVHMGSYGIGTTRLMGAMVEALGSAEAMVWPKEVAPYVAHVIALGEDASVMEEATAIYEAMQKRGVSVLFDDREGKSPGEKFADADLLGAPLRIVVGSRGLAEGVVEVTNRLTGEVEQVPKDKAGAYEMA